MVQSQVVARVKEPAGAGSWPRVRSAINHGRDEDMKKRYFAPFALVPTMIAWVLRRHEERKKEGMIAKPQTTKER